MIPDSIPRIFCLLLVAALLTSAPLSAQIATPAEFVGFEIGADRELFGWQEVVDYFRLLDAHSDRLKVEQLGESTQGRPFLMAIISSPFNLLNLARYKNLQQQAANPRHLSEDDMRLLAAENKAVVMITLNIHSTEIAASQESIELAYRLVTEQSERTRRILDNVIVLLVPSMNPDGMQMVVDWYNKYVGTEFEGSPLPYPYHPYAGHDNNRDWFMMNLIETRLISRQYYQEWFPHLIYDQHQMGSSGPRLFLPPYADPVNPNLHPLLLAQMNKFGKHAASELQSQGLQGVVTDAFFTAWWQGTSVMTPWWHNQMGILSEVASVRIATPLHFPRGSLQSGRRGLEEYNQRMNFLDPWPGGWWRLRDIIDYELATTFSLLDLAAREKESVIYNFCKMNRDAITRGQTEPPYAFVVPDAPQHDRVVAHQMIAILLRGGVEVHQAESEFTAGGYRFQAGDFVILLSQPFRPYVKDLLEPQHYPDIITAPGGEPIRPYDVTGWTLPYMMGVDVHRIEQPFDADLNQIEAVTYPRGQMVGSGKAGVLLSHDTNRSFILVNRLLSAGKKVYWLREPLSIREDVFPAGSIFVHKDEVEPEQLRFMAQELGIIIHEIDSDLTGHKMHQLKKSRLGLYQPWTANIDEGWTRFILESYEFPYRTIHNDRMRGGRLSGDFDVIILPDMAPKEIVNGRKKDARDIFSARIPHGYEDGIMDEGVENLREFVNRGGTLIALDSACDFAIEKFGLPVKNVMKDTDRADFFCPGALLRLEIDPREPIAYGMPQQTIGMFSNSPAFRPLYWTKKTTVAAYYPQRDILASGWILGESRLSNLSAVLDIPVERGRVILLGFRAQHRAQTPGTYKFLFNGIHLAGEEEVVLEN